MPNARSSRAPGSPTGSEGFRAESGAEPFRDRQDQWNGHRGRIRHRHQRLVLVRGHRASRRVRSVLHGAVTLHPDPTDPRHAAVHRGEARGSPRREKGISAFRAFSISAASRVGTGNIAGVAIAISIGGPGALFWMWAMALIGASTAFVESTLAQLYKVRDKGAFRGGPAYYMQYGLGKRWMGMIFAVIITITYGFVFNAVQTNSIVDAVSSSVGEKTTGLQVGIGIAWRSSSPWSSSVGCGASRVCRRWWCRSWPLLPDHRNHRRGPQHR